MKAESLHNVTKDREHKFPDLDVNIDEKLDHSAEDVIASSFGTQSKLLERVEMNSHRIDEAMIALGQG